MKIQTKLPKQVHAMCYVKNSHFIELEDDDGNKTKVNATGVVRYDCTACKYTFLAFENNGEISCPLCQAKGAAKPKWYVPQLSFVPEKKSDFKGGFGFECKDKEPSRLPKSRKKPSK